MGRISGVLLHISSLPGEYSCGSMGKEARAFIDRLAEGGFSAWQMLPLCIPDGHGSPYSSCSSFSLNPFFLDLEALAEEGLLTGEELAAAKQHTPYSMEWERLCRERMPLLRKAAMRAMADKPAREAVEALCAGDLYVRENCRYLALREKNPSLTAEQLRTLEPEPEDFFFQAFLHHTFLRQWESLHAYAKAKGIALIGDLPIYVAAGSADVLAFPEQFQVDAAGRPERVAGVPPDYFSPEGQLWGNPLYDWERMEKDGFSWWRARLEHGYALFDGLRIDHFRGIASYWSVPVTAKSAAEGEWVPGPREKLLPVLREAAKGKLLIAEDLGTLTPDVTELLEKSGLPGMRVLQFGFTGEGAGCPHLPHNYIPNCVAYSGTHDNNTLLGYVFHLNEGARRELCEYVGWRGDPCACLDDIERTLLMSAAGTVIFPVQDLLRYGEDTRMNIPGRAEGNWMYRVTGEQLDSIDWKRLWSRNLRYGRIRTAEEIKRENNP